MTQKTSSFGSDIKFCNSTSNLHFLTSAGSPVLPAVFFVYIVHEQTLYCLWTGGHLFSYCELAIQALDYRIWYSTYTIEVFICTLLDEVLVIGAKYGI